MQRLYHNTAVEPNASRTRDQDRPGKLAGIPGVHTEGKGAARARKGQGRLFLRDSKTGPRTVWLSSPARKALDGIERTGQWIFPAPRTEGPSARGWLACFWSAIRAEAELCDVRLHDLRHTHASIALRQGETVLAIGRLLGHRSAKITLKYTHPDDAMVMHAAESVGAILER